MDNKIYISSVYKEYKNKIAINNLNLELESPLILGIVGPNNSGKSTILRILAGLVKIDSGYISIFNNNPGKITKSYTSTMVDKDIVRSFKNVIVAMNFYEYFYDDFNRSKCEKILGFFSIDRKTSLNFLSKDLIAKIYLALTLSRDSKLYLLDGPGEGLDSISREEIIKCIKNNINPNSIVIITSLLIEEYQDIFTHLAIINKGIVISFDKVEDIINICNKSLKEYYKEALGGDHFD